MGNDLLILDYRKGKVMLFSSLSFLFVFLPSVLFCYYLVPRKLKNFILLIFSLFFYGYGGPRYLLVMLASIFLNYIFGLLVDRYRNHPVKIKWVLVLTVVCNIFIIGYYKYTNFLVENINSVLGSHIEIGNIVMPIGISFFTFQAMSYVIDVYRGDGRVQYNPLNVALYIVLFPQLIAGPIVRYETVDEQIQSRKETVSAFTSGIQRFVIGLGKKVIIANTFGLIADDVFSLNPSDMSVLLAWVGAIAYSAQIYFDFSGYSDMAIGLGRMFGFEFLENFDYPYISKSITEFWRRWHISLSTWFRDYLYIPLGGNKVSTLKHLRNILIVWFLTGLWHGASWTFIAWGLYYGALLVVEKYILKKYIDKLWAPLQHIYALFFVIVGWILFRANTFEQAFGFIKTMVGLNGTELISNHGIYYLIEYKVEIIIMLIAATPLGRNLVLKLEERQWSNIGELGFYLGKYLYLIVVFILCIMYLVGSSFNPFIYFRF
ncbi:alginate O-acetyltransferase complex protein AlgI [Clostridium punense]|uniref:Alginate O-acetyltransferase complex protein AlgI n=2 Tax=Clostridium TaxID=1485 RepID=A0ABS4K1N7_9CLOT|nr:hypothetical protein M918_04415 [Clostridium sp. BL8]MBP2021165.1 alginate O-acetyltransferase complex protein AlgI [Clostridium punense]